MNNLIFATTGFVNGPVQPLPLAPTGEETIVDRILRSAHHWPDRVATVQADGISLQYRMLPVLLARSSGYRMGSSGTTGDPKASIVTDAMVQARVARLIRAGSPLTMFCVLNPLNILNTVEKFQVLLNGGTFFSAGSSTDPKVWLDMCERHEVDTLFIFPGHPALKAMIDLHHPYRFRRIMVGGELCSIDQLNRLRDAFGYSLMFRYGASECGLIAYGYLDDINDFEGCVGQVVPDLSVEVEDERIKVKGPGVITGYLDNPRLNEARFRDGWFYPGDLGYFYGDRLVLRGREDEVVVTAQ